VLCEGTDFSGVSSAFEFDFNAEVAANLGCPILVLVNGRHKATDAIVGAVHMAQESFENKSCSIAATIVNRVALQQIDAVAKRFESIHADKGPLYILPKIATLGKSTVKDLSRGCLVTDIVNTVAITAVQAQTV
jgi:phosphate acetyltransferase